MKQKIYKTLLLVIFTMAGLSASAHDCEVNGIYYDLNKRAKTATVTYYGSILNSAKYTGSVVIPKSITYEKNNYSVTTIGEDAFHNCTGLTSVTIPNSVTTIGEDAFCGCTGLTSITIPNSVTSIEKYAFYGCTGLTNITIPSSVTSIGDCAFYKCTGLTSITIPNSVTTIGKNAFYECTGLTMPVFNATLFAYMPTSFQGDYIIPDSIQTICGAAFSDCKGLTSVTIPNSVTTIGEYAFSGCTGLTNITIPNSVTTIGEDAFNRCTGLTSITIPNSVTTIGGNVFSYCTGLEKIVVEQNNTVYDSRDNSNAIIETASNALIAGCKSTVIPNNVTTIGKHAFYGCTGLTSITIPNSVTKIRNSAFYGCTGLKKIIVPDIGAWCNISFIGGDNSNPLYYAHHIYSDEETEITKLVIPNSVTTIGDYAFNSCTALTSITIPNSVTTIGGYAFCSCTGLTNITIPNSVTTIGEDAFWRCSGLTSVTIGNSVISIGNYAFYDCKNLQLIVCHREDPPSAELAFSDINAVTIVPPSSVSKYKAAKGWEKLSFNIVFKHVGTTQTTVSLATNHNLFTDTYVKVNSDETRYNPVNDTIVIKNLKPNTTYSIATFGKFPLEDGSSYSMESSFDVTTLGIGLDYKSDVTNCTATITGRYEAGDADVTESGFVGYEGKNEIELKGLTPGKEYTYTYYVKSADGSKFTKECTVTTVPIRVSATATATTTVSRLAGSYSIIDATVIDYGFTDYPQQTEVRITGLDPSTQYKKTFYVKTKEGGIVTKDIFFTTKALTMITQQPKVISAGNVIVAAETNVDDEESNVGFEWRRTDWTDEFPSNAGGAYLYEGLMEGYIRNLYTEKLWKYRPYYESNAGNRYYGDWVGIDPTNTSYFEPTVHTYATVQVNGNTASVKGYAMRGTDNVSSQGFKYWKSSASNTQGRENRALAIPADAMTIEATGQVMTVTINDLDYESDYCYVAFVTTSEGETFYGELQTFQTGVDTSGVEDVKTTNEAYEVGRYDMRGRRLDTPQHGLNIIRMSDGTTKKVMVK